MHTFTGVFDEAWFYLVPVVIDYHGSSIINSILSAQKAILTHDLESVVQNINHIATRISELIPILKRMYERCDPQVFWRRVRAYSGGSKNSERFPNGIFYEGVLDSDHHVNLEMTNPPELLGTWRAYPGASAGQSPLIHTIDVALSIEHQPIGTCPVSGSTSTVPCPSSKSLPNPMLEMREALPKEFQEFIRDLSLAPNIKQFCEANKQSQELIFEFNRACQNMKEFRDIHLQMATKYIVLQRQGNSTAVGTGGTDLVPFLKQVRQETQKNKIS
jgi:indoleamine 2,3-dioxygenase